MDRKPPDSPTAPSSLDLETAAAVLDVAQLLVVVLDPEGRILRFNHACETTTGYRESELLGRPVWQLIPAAERDQVEAVFRGLGVSDHSNSHENAWLTKAGERRVIAWSNTATRNDDGSVSRVIGTGIDVTDVRSSETVQRESQQQLTEIVYSAMDAIVSVDESQTIQVFNPAAERMFGRTSAETLGRSLELLVPERFHDVHRQHTLRFAHSGETSRRMGELGHVWGIRASGEEFPVEASISRASSEGKTLLTVILRDVSERARRKELELRLRESEERASIGNLIAGLAHDIGTPMNVILGYIEMIGRSLTSEKDRDRIQIVREQVERVVGLVQTLMNFARSRPEKAASVQIEDVSERALDLIPEMARRRGITIERDYAGTSPIRAQGERLERAFLNLFVNACDAMRDGGVLRVSSADRDGGVEIRVADTGSGMSEEVRAHIFEPFFTTKEAGEGSGLGLFVTRSIIVEQGGSIEVLSEPGKGCEIVIRLPREPASVSRVPDTPRRSDRPR